MEEAERRERSTKEECVGAKPGMVTEQGRKNRAEAKQPRAGVEIPVEKYKAQNKACCQHRGAAKQRVNAGFC